jgi:hypothetical protein
MIAPARTHHNVESDCAGLAEATRQAMAMLAAIFAPDDWICFHAVGQGGGKRWATLADDEIEPIIEWVWRANTRSLRKCQPFFGANARRGHGQDKAEGTSHAPCYFADWEGITIEQAIALILAAGLPMPTVIIESGRGVHAYWRLHEPETHASEWTHRQKWIAAAVRSDPAVSDWQRKMRLPGLLNVKEKYAPDYPLSRLVFAEPSRRYSWRDLQPRHMPEPQQRPEPTREQLAEVARLPPGSMSELARRFIEEGFTLPEGRRHTGFTVACDLAARGWKLEPATDCIRSAMARWIGRGDKPLTRADVDDVPRQVLTAFSKPRTPIIDGAGAAPLRIEHAADDDTEVVPLGEYRDRIAAAVSQAVRVRGVHLNTGGTGCGKTFATAKEVAKLARSVTSAPTHALCEELAAQLRSFGADAAAYPPLDSMTCANYAEASRVQAAGLSPGRVLCNGCPFKTACEINGYLAAVKAADKARHKVVTHARLARSAKTVCRAAKCVVLEEEPTAAVRPSIAARGKELAAVATFAKLVAKRLRHEQADGDVDLSGVGFTDPEYGLPTGDDAFAEFAAWAPPADAPAAATGKETARDVVHGPRRRVRALQAKRLHKAAFFRHVADVARYVHVETRAAMRRGSGVYVIPMPAAVKPPKNIDGIVWPLMAEASEPVPPDALRLAVAAASGGLQTLVVQVDANERYAKSHPEAKPLLRARAIGLWQTAIPYRTASVIVNDGTNDLATVQAIVGREVHDITPRGRVPLQHECVQYACDVTLGTSAQTVANIVCGIARANPDKPRLGAIMLKAHRDELLPGDDASPVSSTPRRGRKGKRGPLLPRAIRRRIEWHTHYGSGLDRGSNDMHERVDLAIVVGTFRPPPHEVRRRLVEMGLIEEAHNGDRWGVIERHARRPDGTPITYTGLGYASEAWRRAAESLSRAAVRQAIGRARANTSRGAAVVAVTTEATGLPVLPATDLPRSKPEVERVAEAVRAAGSTSAKSAINNNSGFGTSCPEPGATLAAVQARLPRVPRRTLLRWLATAAEVGAVIRTGHTTATRYALPVPPERPSEPPALTLDAAPERCPSCGSDEHRDTVSSDGQVGRRVCAECGTFVRFTVWHGNPVPPATPPPLSARVLDVAATVRL